MKLSENSDQKCRVCIVAILRDEEKFLDEWIAYHRIIGIDHFFLYDDGENAPLKEFLAPHSGYTTVIPWFANHNHLPGRNKQTKAYQHAVDNYAGTYDWVSFLDIDEFIVLRLHDSIKTFLESFYQVGSVSLNWHIFGHSGFYDDPPGLITATLLRRRLKPGINVKSITRPAAISSIHGAHFCRTKHHARCDANGNAFVDRLYPGKSDVAHINHYQCRSFKRWMKRFERGDVHIHDREVVEEDQVWRTSKERLLKHFVETVAKDANEYEDHYLLKFKKQIKQFIKDLERTEGVNFPGPVA